MMEYSLDGHNVSLSAIRTVRVLRPLRAINRVPSKCHCCPEYEISLYVLLALLLYLDASRLGPSRVVPVGMCLVL